MTTQWTRRGNQAKGRKKDIGRFKSSLNRGMNRAHKFSCTRYAVCVHVKQFVKARDSYVKIFSSIIKIYPSTIKVLSETTEFIFVTL